uniref:Uncharacterized protein n=1 Tax=Fagus sylvatica TaxID=28930 RepID=A0A2N9IWL6_FAGSY
MGCRDWAGRGFAVTGLAWVCRDWARRGFAVPGFAVGLPWVWVAVGLGRAQ